MEDHSDTSETRESLVNVMIGGPREDENEDNFVTNNRCVFKENSHPDEKTRLELATNLFVGKKQVQFWFQNKRSILKHARLKNELTRIAIHADKFLAPSTFLEGSLTSMMENFGLELLTERDETSDINVVDDLSLNEVDFGKYLSSPLSTNLVNKDLTLDKSMLLNLALDALNELLKLEMSDEPFWVRSLDGGGEILNMEEYARSFIPIIGIKPSHFTIEATRSIGTVVGNSLTLVEMLINESQWVDMFPCIIGKVSTFDVISTGIGESKSGTLLLLESINLQIETKLQIISNVIPIHEIQFLCFCQKHVEATWIIVDVSIDTVKEGSQQYKIEKCQRLPSGCIIQVMPNGYSKHVEYDEIFVHHLYLPLIRAGLGFGAQRWMSSFKGILIDSKGEIGMGILAQRMTRNFCAGICANSNKWKTIQIENRQDTNFMMRNNISDPGEPISVGDDIIANQNNMLIFQDTCTDATGSLLVYAIIDSSKMNTVMKGGDSSCVELLPNGISIVPYLSQYYSANNNNGGNNNEFCSGSLVTIRFQMLVDNLSTTDLPKKSIIEANDIISHTIHKIKTALKCK
ncbi:hypothetical protein R3W88_016771 [Solanum pinnatisectum]|uniref:Uncharacterized protein n=1 Tax=Solanum pinnatisectum TaxID=50273 RepID=A0AAV9KYH4_9SOLN|nr:hypothetical protein R3W88_016771 [Solanum pinnatisectum]